MTAQAHSLSAKAEADVTRYCTAMMQPNGWQACLNIERQWGLDGYTPQIVTSILDRISRGEDRDAAESAVLNSSGYD